MKGSVETTRIARACLVMGCAGVHYGTLWKPSRETKRKHPGETDYQIAVGMGLCSDPLPADRSHCALVEFDDHPGVLECHSWQTLKVII